MPFLNDLILKVIPGSTWQVAEPLFYQDKKYGLIKVPAGFKTDLASVPRIAWRIVNSSTPGTRRPAVVHDYIYTQLTNYFSRKQADKIFYRALRECGVNYLLANAMYFAVRIGGKSSWGK